MHRDSREPWTTPAAKGSSGAAAQPGETGVGFGRCEHAAGHCADIKLFEPRLRRGALAGRRAVVSQISVLFFATDAFNGFLPWCKQPVVCCDNT